MAVQLNSSSYLLFSDFLNVDGVEFWRLPNFPQLLPQDDDIYIQIGRGKYGQRVTDEERLRIDLLSYRIYETPHLWWAIALRNNYEIVPTAFKGGENIIVCSPRYIFQEILPKAGR